MQIKQEKSEIEKIKEFKAEIEKLAEQIKRDSAYECLEIGDIIAELVTIYENKEYRCLVTEPSFASEREYIITENQYKSPIYRIKITKTLDDKKDICCLFPSEYKSLQEAKTGKTFIEWLNEGPEYIQLFIDYLYKRRTNKKAEKIDKKELNLILKAFVEETKELQDQTRQKREEIERYRKISEEKSRFQSSCVINRKMMYHIILYIIKYYEENMFAKDETQRKITYYHDDGQGYEISEALYHNLIIQYNGKKISYQTYVDSNKDHIDYEDNFTGLDLDANQDTKINFFKIKNKLLPAIDNSVYLKEFFKKLESTYESQISITTDKLEELLADISNLKKQKKKVRQ